MIKILIPVDGSPASKYSIEQAIATGIAKDKEVHLITVVSPAHKKPTRNPGLNKELAENPDDKNRFSADAYDIPTLNPSLNAELLEALVTANTEYAHNLLEETKAVLSPVSDLKSAVIREGDPAEEILRYADEIGSNLIIMGNRGLGTFSKIFLGSVSQKILTHSCCSVLISKKPNK